MAQVFFAQNAAIIRASLPISIEVNPPSLSGIREALGWGERFFAAVMLLALSPLLLCIALVGKLLNPGPVFYSQIRVGRGGKHFWIHKFRTMVENAEDKTGPVLSWKGDPRVTPWGNFLRKTHLDEVPQLLNVVQGEMSFVGPRPERPEFVEEFSHTIENYTRRLEVRPGITGLAQICCPYDVDVKEKLEYDLLYIRHRNSLRVLFFILYRTALKVLLIH